MTGARLAHLDGVDVWVPAGLRLLSGVTWTVAAGEHWALLGANGAGKSTLLSVLSGQRFPSAGTAEILGSRLGRVDVREIRRRIGLVDGRLRMPGELTVEEYVATGLTGTVQLLTPYDDDPRVSDLLGLVGLASLHRRDVAVLSAGERARARLARALVAEPELLLLDEPAAGLDLPGRADLLTALETVAAQRVLLGSIVVAHHLEELPATTTHVALLRAGRLVRTGPTDVLGDGEALSDCFGRPVRTHRIDGRWFASA